MRTLFSLLLSLPLSLAAATFPVTTVADSGPGSLRQAILDANHGPCSPADPCRIAFAIPAPVPTSGWFTIRPESPLPVIDRSPIILDAASQTAVTGDTNQLGPEIELDGTNAGYRSGLKAWATYSLVITGFAINRFEGHGIFVDSGSFTHIAGNYIGVDPTGTVARPNGLDGIALRNSSGGRIDHNIISGNHGNGVYVGGGTETYVGENRIGVGRAGDFPIPNGGSGIDAIGTRMTIEFNTVAHNRTFGISVTGDGAVHGNHIFGNALLGITNGFGRPGSQGPAPPVITSAVENSISTGYYTGFHVVKGELRSTGDTDVIVSAYVSPHLEAGGDAEGKLFIGRKMVRTNAEGYATFEIQRDLYVETLDIFGGFVTATAQPVFGTTSEFSRPFPITVTTPTFEVTSSADAGTGSLRDAISRANGASCTVDFPCRITFNVAPETSPLQDGAARIVLDSPLPPIRGYVRLSGASQTWWHGDTNEHGPEVEIRGGDGIQFGTLAEPVIRAYVHGIAINGSTVDGLTIHAAAAQVPQISQPRIIVSDIYSGTDVLGRTAMPNRGSGIRLTGGASSPLLQQTNVRITNSLFSGNEQHGVLLGGEMHLLSGNAIGTDASRRNPLPNADDGVHVVEGTLHQLNDNLIAYNGDAGVATDRGVRLPSVLSSVHRNGGLGLDVNSDGITPSDGNNEDGTIDPPRIDRVYFDAERGVTVIEGIAHPDARPFGVPAFDGAGDRFGNAFFISSERDPSGRGEGEQYQPPYSPPLMFAEGGNGTFRIGLRGDLRGKWFTATTNRFYCYYEFGCTSRESSEFGNAVDAK